MSLLFEKESNKMFFSCNWLLQDVNLLRVGSWLFVQLSSYDLQLIYIEILEAKPCVCAGHFTSAVISDWFMVCAVSSDYCEKKASTLIQECTSIDDYDFIFPTDVGWTQRRYKRRDKPLKSIWIEKSVTPEMAVVWHIFRKGWADVSHHSPLNWAVVGVVKPCACIVA